MGIYFTVKLLVDWIDPINTLPEQIILICSVLVIQLWTNNVSIYTGLLRCSTASASDFSKVSKFFKNSKIIQILEFRGFEIDWLRA